MTLYRTDSFVFIGGKLTRSSMSLAAEKSSKKCSFDKTKDVSNSAKLERLMKRWSAHGKARENDFKNVNFNSKNPQHWNIVDKYDT